MKTSNLTAGIRDLLGNLVSLKRREAEIEKAAAETNELLVRTDGALAFARKMIGEEEFTRIVEEFNAGQSRATVTPDP